MNNKNILNKKDVTKFITRHKKTILIHTSAAEIIQLNPTVEYSCHQHQ